MAGAPVSAPASAEGVEVVPLLSWGNYHSSDDSFPASSLGSSHTPRWRPNPRNTDYYRSRSWVSVGEAKVSVEVEAVPVLSWGNYHSSDDNFPASSLRSPRTLRWRPNLRSSD